MKPLSPPIERVIRLVISGLFGFSLGTVVWMFTLPSGFISKRSLAIAAIVTALFAFLFYRFLIPLFIKQYRHFKFNGWIIGVVLALLTGIVFQKVVAHQSLVFPFTPRQTIQLISRTETLSFRPIECELVTLYAKDFQVKGDLERISSKKMILRGTGSSLTWRGWPGSTCIFTVIEPEENAVVEITWGSEKEILQGIPAGQVEFVKNLTFTIPFASQLIIAGFLTFAVAACLLGLTCGYMALLIFTSRRSSTPVSSFDKWLSGLLTISLVALNLVIILRLLYSANPYTHFPGRDQGVFLYIGQGLLSGQTPYLDAWDHKGPLIYFINALGILLDPAGEWGVFALMVIFLAATIVILYFLLRKKTEKYLLLVGLAIFLGLILEMRAFDNLVELYALPFYALGILAVMNANNKKSPRHMFLFGFSAAMAFSLRPNLVSIFTVAGIFWTIEVIKRKEKICRGILYSLAGVLLVIVPFIIFFTSRGALPDLFDQVIRYNFFYSTSTSMSIWEKITQIRSSVLPVVLLGLVGLFFSMGIGLNKHRDISNPLGLVLTCSFFIELILSRLSGYDFTHYSLPLLMLATLIMIEFLRTLFENKDLSKNRFLRWSLGFAAIMLIIPMVIKFTIDLANENYLLRGEEFQESKVSEILKVRPTLLVWGAEVQINYLMGLPAPTRYMYQYPLVTKDYCTSEKGAEFLKDISEELPVILDTSNSNPWIPAFDREKRKADLERTRQFGSLDCLQGFFDFTEKNYSPIFIFKDKGWTIYLPNITERNGR